MFWAFVNYLDTTEYWWQYKENVLCHNMKVMKTVWNCLISYTADQSKLIYSLKYWWMKFANVEKIQIIFLLLLLLLYYILFIIILFYLYVLFNKINRRVF